MSDGYTGQVEPDGDWQERRDGRLLIRKLSVEEMDNDVYVVADTATREAFLIDAAARPDRLREALAGFAPVAVLQTHGHWDHVRAWEELRNQDGIPIWGHRGDADLFPRDADRWLEHGDVLPVGAFEVEVVHTPGHTPGSLVYLVRGDECPHLFTGDSLFPGGPGNTWGDPDRFAELMGHLEERVFGPLPDQTWVYPGHGDDTTLGDERGSIPEWRERGW